MPVGDASAQQEYRLLLYKSGSLYKCKSGITELIEIEDTVLSTVFAGIKTTLAQTGEPLYIYPNTNYAMDTTVNFDSTNNYLDIAGTGNSHRTLFRPQGNFPVFTLSGISYWNMDDIGFYHTQNPYTSNLLQLNDSAKLGNAKRLYFVDANGTRLGNGIGFVASTIGTQAFNKFENIDFFNLDTAIYFDTSTATNASPWINSNTFLHCTMNGCKWWRRSNHKVGGADNGNDFMLCHAQANVTETLGGFDYDDSGTHSLTNLIANLLWDLKVDGKFLNVNDKTKVVSVGNTPMVRTYGTGLNNGANIINLDNRSMAAGYKTFAGNGITYDFTVTHNLEYIPDSVTIFPASRSANKPHDIINKTTTQFTVRFHNPPPPSADPADANNIKFKWLAIREPF